MAGVIQGDEVSKLGGGARLCRPLWSLLKFGLLLCRYKELFTVVEHRRIQSDLHVSNISLCAVLCIDGRKRSAELLKQVCN